MKTTIIKAIKQGIEISFGFAFWFVFGGFILIAGMTKGIGLAIVLSILFGAGYWTIKKVTKYFIKKGKQQNQSTAGIN